MRVADHLLSSPTCIFGALPTRKHGQIVLIIAVFAWCQAFSFGQQKTIDKPNHAPSYHYDVEGIQLEGMLGELKVYGPPGFGETPDQDERATILILKLPRAITVEPLAHAKAKDSPNLATARNIHEVQLFVGRSQTAEARKLLGKNVVVVGTLNEAVAPSQYTKVWLDTKTLSPKATSTAP
jgi:hypothetical protein